MLRLTKHAKLIDLNHTQKLVLGLGSAATAVSNPWRADMVAVAGEALYPEHSLKRLVNSMNLHPVGRQILAEKPILTMEVLENWKLEKMKIISRRPSYEAESTVTLDEFFERQYGFTFGYHLLGVLARVLGAFW